MNVNDLQNNSFDASGRLKCKAPLGSSTQAHENLNDLTKESFDGSDNKQKVAII